MRLLNEFELKDLLSNWQSTLLSREEFIPQFNCDATVSTLLLSSENGFAQISATHSYLGLSLFLKAGGKEVNRLHINADLLNSIHQILKQR